MTPPSESTNTPDVSVVITVLDGLPYIEAAVGSVLRETSPDLELIVVDDGSADGTADVLDTVRDPRLRVVRRPHLGRVPSLNHALQLARGRYVANLDADDLALPGRFSVSAEFLDSHPDVAAVGSTLEPYVGFRRPPRRLPQSDRAIRWSFLLRNPMFNSSVTYRTESLRAIGGFSMAYADRLHDADVLLRLGRQHRLANLPQALSARRLHDRQHFAAVDRRTRGTAHARCRWRAAAELGFPIAVRPVAYLVAAVGVMRSVLVLRLLGRNGRMKREGVLNGQPHDVSNARPRVSAS